MSRTLPAAPFYRSLKELRDLMEAAITTGDWVVDGACDPDSALQRASQLLAMWDGWRECIDDNFMERF